MFNIFISEKFFWDDVYCSDKSVVSVDFNSDIIVDRGCIYSNELESDTSYKDYPFYTKGDNTIDDIVLNLCLVGKGNLPKVWDDYTLDEVCNWLITDEFKPFISEDNLENIYYLKVKKISKKFTSQKTGYLEVTFQRYSNYTYKKIIKNILVDGEREISIMNSSNADEYYMPIFEVKNVGDELTTNTIQNISLPETKPLEIESLDTNEKITIDNLYYTVIDEDGKNRFSTVNRQWIKLKKGNNVLKFTGKCEVILKALFPIAR